MRRAKVGGAKKVLEGKEKEHRRVEEADQDAMAEWDRAS